ncbi:MAG TPA: glycoside hydrolase family 6 protein [Streptosporangiaceae bacterium]
MLSAGVAGIAINQASAAAGCRVTYTVTNQWDTGFGASLSITNLGDPLTSWTLAWDFPNSSQRVSSGWNGTFSQTGQHVTVASLSYNGSVGTNQQVTSPPGFNGAYSGTNPVPTSFTLNGTPCTGGTTTPPTTPPTTPTTTPPTTPTTTPPTTPTTTPPAGSHVDNPYAGADGYINPDYAAEVNDQAQSTGGTLGQQMARVAQQPTAVWLDRIAAVTGGTGVTRTLAGHLDAAVQQDSANGSRPLVITIVVYDLPNRDCAALASNGELKVSQDGLNKYKTQYIDAIMSVLSQSKYSNLRISAIIEPDSLPNLVTNLGTAACAEANSSGAYVQGIQYALSRLHTLSNVYNYIDIAHSGWLGWSSNFGPAADLIANTVKGATGGVNTVDGFISNTANYTPTTEPFMTATQTVGGQQVRSSNFYQFNDYIDEGTYAAAMRQAFVSRGFPNSSGNSIGMLIDTSRNGWGGSGPQGSRPTGASTSTDVNTFVTQSKIDRRVHRGNWCNQFGGIGARPTANPASGFDAYVWIKPPGESDGASQPVSNDEGKGFDQMCDPTFHGSSQANGGNLTEAIPNAPLAGHFFPDEFKILVQNAFPAL